MIRVDVLEEMADHFGYIFIEQHATPDGVAIYLRPKEEKR